MESLLAYINWNVNPEIFRIGSFAIRWYGLLFVSSFIFGFFLLKGIWKREGYHIDTLDKLTMYMMFATIIGARLGHCLFYQPEEYLRHPLDILKIWEGGLASHGAALGIIAGIYIFVRLNKEFRFLWVIDRVVLVVALSGFFIRSGNLMNSEIYGKPTYSSYGFVYAWDASRMFNHNPIVKSVSFEKEDQSKLINGNSLPLKMKIEFNKKANDPVQIKSWMINEISYPLSQIKQNEDSNLYCQISNNSTTIVSLNDKGLYTGSISVLGVPRHPTQIYEALCYLLLFIFLVWFYYKNYPNFREGTIFAIFLIVLFSIRFIIEFLKVPQVQFESKLPLNMGQLLSLPFIALGVILLYYLKKKPSPVLEKDSTDENILPS